jgi:hypothetical protein
MAIITHTQNAIANNAYLNIFPDQFKSEKEKKTDTYIKETMDYFAAKAYAEYTRNRETFVKNYDLVKGILRPADFYEDEPVRSFTETLQADLNLPSYVKHYSIITTPINELIGELSKRPDGYRVKAYDDDSKSEELEFKTQILQDYIMSNARIKIQEKLALQGQEVTEEEIQQLTFDEVKDDIDNYTSVAEKWANHVLNCAKAEFNLKEKSEDAFRDLSISAREYFHIYEDNSKLGFNVEELNPKNVWKLTTPDKKYTSDPSGRARAAYATGTVHVMELSEIIESIPEITKEEIDHLKKSLNDFGLIGVRESNLTNPNVKPGVGSIKYDTYDPLVMQQRALIESELKENNDGLKDFLGLTNNVSAFGYKYVVVRAYFISKKKIGKLVYEDELGNEQSVIVDENYKSGTIPTEISLEWGWINQWYHGLKIGNDIYHMKPFKLLNYSPIIGLDYEIKNTEARSIVDMMKPFQVIYNVCMNQLFDLLKKEIGNVGVINIRRVPRTKDGDAQDDIDIWELEARERGIMFDDDSPENTKAPVTNTSVAKNVDLTRSQEIQSRYNLAVQMKNECWELIGMSKQRLGSISASETATGTNTAITQSYSQTEPMFVAHEYVIGQVYQAILDAAQYVATTKPESTLSYITSQGESAFIQINRNDILLRDLKVFPTNRPEDKKLFEEIRLLAQPLLQNGGSFADVIELYSTDSIRQMKRVFKTLRDKQEEFQNQQLQNEQQALAQEKEIAQAQIEQQSYEAEQERIHDDYQREMDRINKKEIAIIGALGFGKVKGEDTNANQIPDVFEASRFALERDSANKEHQLRVMEMNADNKNRNEELKIEKERIKNEKEKLKNERLNMKNDKEIEQLRLKAAKAKAAKAKPKAKSKK